MSVVHYNNYKNCILKNVLKKGNLHTNRIHYVNEVKNNKIKLKCLIYKKK